MTAPEFDRQANVDPALLQLASRALRIMLAGPRDEEMQERAQAVVKRISVEHPDMGLWTACLAWCDTLQNHVPGLDAKALADAGLAFVQADTGRRSFADDTVPEAAQWAGRFLFARLRDDADTAHALFVSTTDGWQMGARVLELLLMCAINIERGQVDMLTREQVVS